MSDFDENKLFKKSVPWRAVSGKASDDDVLESENLSGKILCGENYAGQDLSKADFTAANLREANFSKANLEGANFTSADLSGANLREANLNGAVFSNAVLRNADFRGAKMKGVILEGADIQDAILLDIEMDRIALDELQALVEWLAIFYPHKLNLKRLNLALLDLSKIDLRALDLRGVDLTGVNFTGVNIWELDLSETNITPEQIAQALGRPATPKELKQIMAPKKRRKRSYGIDFSSFFDSRGTFGVLDLTKHPGITVAALLKMGKRLYNFVITKPELEDHEIMAQFRQSLNLTDEDAIKKHKQEIARVVQERQEKERESQDFKENKTIDITDYEAFERAQKAEKENKIKESREKYRENDKRAQETAREIYAYARSRGQRERG